MPIGSEFRNAATKLRGEAIIADRTQSGIQSVNDVGVWYAGPYRDALYQALDASIINTGIVAGEARRLAVEYDRRAGVCDTYTGAMQQWRVDDGDWVTRNTAYQNDDTGTADWPGVRPIEPTRSPDWVREDFS